MVGSDGEIKLIDFGFSVMSFSKKCVMNTSGSRWYQAPEVFTRYYGKECDVWSLGISFYEIFAEDRDQYALNRQGEYIELKNVSNEFQDLLSKMLQLNPEKRITVPEILAHPWFKKRRPTRRRARESRAERPVHRWQATTQQTQRE